MVVATTEVPRPDLSVLLAGGLLTLCWAVLAVRVVWDRINPENPWRRRERSNPRRTVNWLAQASRRQRVAIVIAGFFCLLSAWTVIGYSYSHALWLAVTAWLAAIPGVVFVLLSITVTFFSWPRWLTSESD